MRRVWWMTYAATWCSTRRREPHFRSVITVFSALSTMKIAAIAAPGDRPGPFSAMAVRPRPLANSVLKTFLLVFGTNIQDPLSTCLNWPPQTDVHLAGHLLWERSWRKRRRVSVLSASQRKFVAGRGDLEGHQCRGIALGISLTCSPGRHQPLAGRSSANSALTAE